MKAIAVRTVGERARGRYIGTAVFQLKTAGTAEGLQYKKQTTCRSETLKYLCDCLWHGDSSIRVIYRDITVVINCHE